MYMFDNTAPMSAYRYFIQNSVFPYFFVQTKRMMCFTVWIVLFIESVFNFMICITPLMQKGIPDYLEYPDIRRV